MLNKREPRLVMTSSQRTIMTGLLIVCTAITLYKAVESYYAEKELERRVGEMLNSPRFTEWEKQQAYDRISSRWYGLME